MYKEDKNMKKFESKVWLSSPTMYSDSMKYVMEAYETNWMSSPPFQWILFRVSM